MPRGWLPRIQVVEYLRAFLIGRAGWSRLGGLLIISGAFGIFRKDVLLEVGRAGHRLHRRGRRAGGPPPPAGSGTSDRDAGWCSSPEPVAWTEVPEDRAVLRKQRRRWHRGLTEIFVRHGRMMFRPRYGVIGHGHDAVVLRSSSCSRRSSRCSGSPTSWFSWRRWASSSSLPGWDVVNRAVVWVLLAASILYAILVTLVALLAEEISFRRYRGLPDLFRAMGAAVEENFGYRQLNAWWRLGGIIEVLATVAARLGRHAAQGLRLGLSGRRPDGMPRITAVLVRGGIIACWFRFTRPAPGGSDPATVERGHRMKKDIHPEYVDTQVTCTCGAKFTTRSTATSGVIHADVCSQCHPFYTGKQKILDTGGRVARFEARYAKAAQSQEVAVPERRSPHPCGDRRSCICPTPAASERKPCSRPSRACSPSTPSWRSSSRPRRRTPTRAWPSASTSATPSSPR